MITSGSASVASTSASARTSRPSASVLSTSTVLPPYIVSTSPGRVADAGDHVLGHRGVGRDRDRAARARRSRRSPRRPRRPRPCRTSSSPCRCAGLMVRPPESKVMPLPTRARCVVGALGRVGQLDQARRAREPGPTPRMPPQPRARRAPSRRAPRCHLGRAAAGELLGGAGDRVGEQLGGVRSPGGVFTQSRAWRRRRATARAASERGDRRPCVRADVAEHDDLAAAVSSASTRLVRRERVAAEHGALGDRAHVLGVVGGQGERDGGGVGDGAGRDAGGAAHAVGRERVGARRGRRAPAAASLDRAARGHPHHLAGACRVKPSVDEQRARACGRRPRRRPRRRAAQRGALAVLDHADDDGVGAGLGGAALAQGVRRHRGASDNSAARASAGAAVGCACMSTCRHAPRPVDVAPARPARRPRREVRRVRWLGDAAGVPLRRPQGARRGARGGRHLRRQPPRQGAGPRPRRGGATSTRR